MNRYVLVLIHQIWTRAWSRTGFRSDYLGHMECDTRPRTFECGHCSHPIRDTYAGVDAGIVCPECCRDDGWIAVPEEV